jgi:hypothetical protein
MRGWEGTARKGRCSSAIRPSRALAKLIIKLHSSNSEPPMSHMGQSQTFGAVRRMSGLLSIADIDRSARRSE